MHSSILMKIIFVCVLFNYSEQQKVVTPPPSHWDYGKEGPDAWHHLYDTCEGESQSPINIRTPHVRYDHHLTPLSLNGYNENMSSFVWNFTHNGHSIVAYPSPMVLLSLSGGGLSGTYYLLQFHLHWGMNPYQGSEHTINDQKFPLEAHFVHRSPMTGALAVLGIIFDLQRDDNPYLNDLLSIANRTVNTSTTIEKQVDLSRLFPMSPSPRFYRYNGSLTTPPCTEGVSWTILKRKVPISAYQMQAFDKNSVAFNFRSPQKLHSRRVVANFDPEPIEGDEEEVGADHHSKASLNHHLSLSTLVSLVLVLPSIFK